MAINFNNKVLITNPTSYHLGRGVFVGGIMTITLGVITHFTDDILLPSSAWIVFGIPMLFIGWVVMKSGLTKN